MYYDEEDLLHNGPQDTVEAEPGRTKQGDGNLILLENMRSATVHTTSDDCVDHDKQPMRIHYT